MQLSFVQTPADENIRELVNRPKEEVAKLFAGPVRTPAQDAVGQEASPLLKDGTLKK